MPWPPSFSELFAELFVQDPETQERHIIASDFVALIGGEGRHYYIALLGEWIGEMGTVNLMAAGERLSPIAFVKRPLLLPAIPPWLRCEIGEASGGKSGGAGR